MTNNIHTMENIENTYIESYSNKLTDSDYYLLSMHIEGSDMYISFYSGWTSENSSESIDLLEQGKEYRRLWLIDPEKTIQDFKLFDNNLSIVNNKEELLCLNEIEGASLVSASVLEKHCSEMLNPVLTFRKDRGFVEYESFSGRYLDRFARGKYRASILNRDGYQCRICGASPDDSVRVRLDVHHIKPWEEGGISTPENLITLCNICHEGISQIDRFKLYEKVGMRVPIHNYEIVSLPKNHTSDQRLKYYSLQSNLVTTKLRKTAKNKKLFIG